MKKIFTALALVAALICFASCKNSTDSADTDVNTPSPLPNVPDSRADDGDDIDPNDPDQKIDLGVGNKFAGKSTNETTNAIKTPLDVIDKIRQSAATPSIRSIMPGYNMLGGISRNVGGGVDADEEKKQKERFWQDVFSGFRTNSILGVLKYENSKGGELYEDLKDAFSVAKVDINKKLASFAKTNNELKDDNLWKELIKADTVLDYAQFINNGGYVDIFFRCTEYEPTKTYYDYVYIRLAGTLESIEDATNTYVTLIRREKVGDAQKTQYILQESIVTEGKTKTLKSYFKGDTDSIPGLEDGTVVEADASKQSVLYKHKYFSVGGVPQEDNTYSYRYTDGNMFCSSYNQANIGYGAGISYSDDKIYYFRDSVSGEQRYYEINTNQDYSYYPNDEYKHRYYDRAKGIEYFYDAENEQYCKLNDKTPLADSKKTHDDLLGKVEAARKVIEGNTGKELPFRKDFNKRYVKNDESFIFLTQFF